MNARKVTNKFQDIKSDIPASIVVFLVAMPLCLGIALASGAPLFSGLISGIIGGIVVGALSGSPLGVSGPAAGLAVIVLNAITDLGGFENFLVAVIIAGLLQVVLGFIRAGIIAYFFPSSVIHGMLAGIGILIFIKQIPPALGSSTKISLATVGQVFQEMHTGVIIVSIVGLGLLLLWSTSFFQKLSFTKVIQGPLVAVISGIVLSIVFSSNTDLAITGSQLVQVPVASSIDGFFANFALPNFSALTNPDIYVTAIVIAVVASLETLLCVEATDKQDPLKRITPTNQELKAQGVGNIIAGFVGGLPVTQVIVRSSANMQAGGKSKMSTIFHGILLLISIILIPNILNLIPKGTLAAILFIVGYKLAKPALFKKMYQDGLGQFVPFVVTVAGIVLTDLLTGIILGMLVAVFIILRNNFKVPYKLVHSNGDKGSLYNIELAEDVTFLNKASILNTLNEIPHDSSVIIDASNTRFIHHDVTEIIEDFIVNAKVRDIKVETVNLYKGKEDQPIQHFTLSKE